MSEAADERCEECGARSREARLEPGAYYVAHTGKCSQNSANQVCERCDKRHVDVTFDKVLACIMELPLGEARDLQQRIVKRLRA